MNVVIMSRSRSGLAWARCSSRKRAGSILGATVIVVVPFEMDLAVLSKDHAVTVAVCGDTLTRIRYTTLLDATRRVDRRALQPSPPARSGRASHTPAFQLQYSNPSLDHERVRALSLADSEPFSRGAAPQTASGRAEKVHFRAPASVLAAHTLWPTNRPIAI